MSYNRISPIPHEQERADVSRDSTAGVFLEDRSNQVKWCIKGPDAEGFLQKRGVAIPDAVGKCLPFDGDAGLVARTGMREFFLETSPSSAALADLIRHWSDCGLNALAVERQDAAIQMSGPQLYAVLRQTCGLDLRLYAGQVVLTRVAGISAMVHLSSDEARCYIWCDASYGAYLWETLGEIPSA